MVGSILFSTILLLKGSELSGPPGLDASVKSSGANPSTFCEPLVVTKNVVATVRP